MRIAACSGVMVLAAAGRGASATALSTDMQAVLDKHNEYRCMHGLTLFTWDEDIAANAQAYANEGNYAHSSNAARVINNEQCGENLAWGYPSRSGVDSTIAWYEEIVFTNNGLATHMNDANPPGNAIGHYTQIVWPTSLKLGCGKGTATVRGMSGDYWVCQYGPGGNIHNAQGTFTETLSSPVASQASCAQGSGSAGSSSSGDSTAGSATPSRWGDALPSSCTPSTPLPHGALCVYGNQCASQFCCPRLKVCLTSSTASVSSTDISAAVGPEMASTVIGIVFDGGTCSNPWSNSQSCMQNSDGEPGTSWDQGVCGCDEEYMVRYNAGTWTSLNTGVAGLTWTCPVDPTAGGTAGGGAGGDLLFIEDTTTGEDLGLVNGAWWGKGFSAFAMVLAICLSSS